MKPIVNLNSAHLSSAHLTSADVCEKFETIHLYYLSGLKMVLHLDNVRDFRTNSVSTI